MSPSCAMERRSCPRPLAEVTKAELVAAMVGKIDVRTALAPQPELAGSSREADVRHSLTVSGIAYSAPGAFLGNEFTNPPFHREALIAATEGIGAT